MSRPAERAQPVWCLLYKHEELSLEPWCSHKSQLLVKKTEEKHCGFHDFQEEGGSRLGQLLGSRSAQGPHRTGGGDGGAQQAKNGGVRSRWTGVSDGTTGFCSRSERGLGNL